MGNIQSSLLNKTVGGWLLIVVAASVYGYRWYQENQRNINRQNARLKGRDVIANQPKKDNKAKKQRVETFASQAKSQLKPSSATATAPETKAAPAPLKSKDEVDDRTFAQQMVNNKQDKFTNKTTSEQKHKQKSVKQSKAKELSETNKAAEANKVAEDSKVTEDNKATEANEVVKELTSSSVVDADADADDDQSPTTSPSVSAADTTGVSDMLEKPSSGPSVLRLTNTEEKPKTAKKTKAPEPTETKKQRQNRQKREQEKALREEQEKQRKVLEEAQRRTARQAEGRAAKDGSAFMAAQKANAWADSISNGVAPKDAPSTHEPLDTFDNTPAKTPETAFKADTTPSATTNGQENKENVKQNGKKTDWAEVPYSEEQQIAMIAEEDDWKPVATKKAKKAKKTSAGVASSEDGSVNENAAPAAAASTAPKSKAVLTNGRPKPQSQFSFAALTDDGADLEDEEEQEWDV